MKSPAQNAVDNAESCFITQSTWLVDDLGGPTFDGQAQG